MADTRRLWRIREQGAPSPSRLLRVARRYALDVGRILRREVEREAAAWLAGQPRADAGPEDAALSAGDASALALRMRRGLLRGQALADRVSFPGAAVQAAVEDAGTIAIRAERAYLVGHGANPRRLAAKLMVPADQVVGIRVAPTFAELQVIQARTRDALDLIKRIPQSQIDGYEKWLTDAVVEGRRYTSIQRELEERLGIDDRHAELIARDQIGKLNGKITEATQQAAGIDRYVWRVTDDSRLRESHEAVADQVFLWSSPPPNTGPYNEAAHPGQAIQCRCGAEPVVPADLRELFGETTPLPQPGDVVPL